MATLPKAYALFETTLQDSITSAGTSMTLVTGTDKEGTNLAGTIGYIIDEGTASEEFVIGATTATAVTSMARGVSSSDGTTEVAENKKAHRKGASIKITNHPLLIRLYRIANGDDAFPDNAQTLGDGSLLASSAAPTSDAMIANKKYIDDTAIAGGAKATEVIYGISKLSVAADSAVAPIAVGDNDNRVPTVDTSTVTADMVAALAGTGTPNGTTGKYVTLDSATATPTASKIPIADGSGKLDDWVSSVLEKTLTAGETIAGATLPVAVYQNTTDNEFYACDGNDTDKLNFAGFGITDGTDGNDIGVQFTGVVPGFTGLSEGIYYYVQDDKTIGVNQGTYSIIVGIAISETQLLIVKENYSGNENRLIASDILKQGADTERIASDASWTKVKEIKIIQTGTIRVAFDLARSAAAGSGEGKIYVNGVAVGTERANATTDYQTFSEDIDVDGEDLVQLYAQNSNGYKVRNFRIYYDVIKYAAPIINLD